MGKHDKLTEALIMDTTIEDIAERYKPIVDKVGLDGFIRLSEYAMGDELYIPRIDTILAPARSRAIKKEFDGFNIQELSVKYDLTIPRIRSLLKDEPPPGQIDIDEWLKDQKN